MAWSQPRNDYTGIYPRPASANSVASGVGSFQAGFGNAQVYPTNNGQPADYNNLGEPLDISKINPTLAVLHRLSQQTSFWAVLWVLALWFDKQIYEGHIQIAWLARQDTNYYLLLMNVPLLLLTLFHLGLSAPFEYLRYPYMACCYRAWASPSYYCFWFIPYATCVGVMWYLLSRDYLMGVLAAGVLLIWWTNLELGSQINLLKSRLRELEGRIQQLDPSNIDRFHSTYHNIDRRIGAIQQQVQNISQRGGGSHYGSEAGAISPGWSEANPHGLQWGAGALAEQSYIPDTADLADMGNGGRQLPTLNQMTSAGTASPYFDTSRRY